jgi:hypothetical protein
MNFSYRALGAKILFLLAIQVSFASTTRAFADASEGSDSHFAQLPDDLNSTCEDSKVSYSKWKDLASHAKTDTFTDSCPAAMNAAVNSCMQDGNGSLSQKLNGVINIFVHAYNLQNYLEKLPILYAREAVLWLQAADLCRTNLENAMKACQDYHPPPLHNGEKLLLRAVGTTVLKQQFICYTNQALIAQSAAHDISVKNAKPGAEKPHEEADEGADQSVKETLISKGIETFFAISPPIAEFVNEYLAEVLGMDLAWAATHISAVAPRIKYFAPKGYGTYNRDWLGIAGDLIHQATIAISKVQLGEAAAAGVELWGGAGLVFIGSQNSAGTECSGADWYLNPVFAYDHECRPQLTALMKRLN